MNRQFIIDDSENHIVLFTSGTPIPRVDRVPEGKQMPLYPNYPIGPQVRYFAFGLQNIEALNLRRLVKNTTSTAQPSALPVVKDIADHLEKLHLFEAIYGYVDGKSCNIVAIANDLQSSQRDKIWKIVADYRRRYSEIDIDLRIVQRRNRPLSDVFEDDGTAILTRVLMPA